LVGDSGERDMYLYGGIARDFPKQISNIYIRNVSTESSSEVNALPTDDIEEEIDEWESNDDDSGAPGQDRESAQDLAENRKVETLQRRVREAFAGVPVEVWRLFEDASVLMPLDHDDEV
jgi:phosphatidate phosphatase APP1